MSPRSLPKPSREQLFSQSGAGHRYAEYARMRQSLARARNPIAKGLIEACFATGEPTFLEALLMLGYYDCAGLSRNPARQLQKLESFVTNRRVADEVDAKVHEDTCRGRRPRMGAAYEEVAASGIIAPTLAAARKRVERTYKAAKAGTFPDGNTGKKLLVGRPLRCAACGHIRTTDTHRCSTQEFYQSPPSGTLGHATLNFEDVAWSPDDRETRRKIYYGGYVILDEYDPEGILWKNPSLPPIAKELAIDRSWAPPGHVDEVRDIAWRRFDAEIGEFDPMVARERSPAGADGKIHQVLNDAHRLMRTLELLSRTTKDFADDRSEITEVRQQLEVALRESRARLHHRSEITEKYQQLEVALRELSAGLQGTKVD